MVSQFTFAIYGIIILHKVYTLFIFSGKNSQLVGIGELNLCDESVTINFKLCVRDKLGKSYGKFAPGDRAQIG